MELTEALMLVPRWYWAILVLLLTITGFMWRKALRQIKVVEDHLERTRELVVQMREAARADLRHAPADAEEVRVACRGATAQ